MPQVAEERHVGSGVAVRHAPVPVKALAREDFVESGDVVGRDENGRSGRELPHRQQREARRANFVHPDVPAYSPTLKALLGTRFCSAQSYDSGSMPTGFGSRLVCNHRATVSTATMLLAAITVTTPWPIFSRVAPPSSPYNA